MKWVYAHFGSMTRRGFPAGRYEKVEDIRSWRRTADPMTVSGRRTTVAPAPSKRKEWTMPLFDFLCLDCGETSEILVTGGDQAPGCGACGGGNLKKLISASSSLSGGAKGGMAGAGDTACCGQAPGHGGCAGPGSCCGKAG